MPLPYPPIQLTPGAIQTTTNDIVAFLDETKSNDDITKPTKRPKQHHSINFKTDHPKLTMSLQAVNMKDTTSQHSPSGVQQ